MKYLFTLLLFLGAINSNAQYVDYRPVGAPRTTKPAPQVTYQIMKGWAVDQKQYINIKVAIDDQNNMTAVAYWNSNWNRWVKYTAKLNYNRLGNCYAIYIRYIGVVYIY